VAGPVGPQGPAGKDGKDGTSFNLTKDKLYVLTFANGTGTCKDANDVLLTYSCSANTLGAQLSGSQNTTEAAAGVICATYPGSGPLPVLTLVCLTGP
jgi:hypothetical protein